MKYITLRISLICFLVHKYYRTLYCIIRTSSVNIIYAGQLILIVFHKEMGECVLDSSGSGQGQVAGPREHGTDSSGSVKFWQFFYLLSNYWFL
jgi:hypothetical protein